MDPDMLGKRPTHGEVGAKQHRGSGHTLVSEQGSTHTSNHCGSIQSLTASVLPRWIHRLQYASHETLVRISSALGKVGRNGAGAGTLPLQYDSVYRACHGSAHDENLAALLLY